VQRLEGTRVTVNALHPGVIGTKLLRAGFGMGCPASTILIGRRQLS
jgi:NAD(P)-dependent dehydrogenase (short-subunit alcohol dehydrogenase family)